MLFLWLHLRVTIKLSSMWESPVAQKHFSQSMWRNGRIVTLLPPVKYCIRPGSSVNGTIRQEGWGTWQCRNQVATIWTYWTILVSLKLGRPGIVGTQIWGKIKLCNVYVWRFLAKKSNPNLVEALGPNSHYRKYEGHRNKLNDATKAPGMCNHLQNSWPGSFNKSLTWKEWEAGEGVDGSRLKQVTCDPGVCIWRGAEHVKWHLWDNQGDGTVDGY